MSLILPGVYQTTASTGISVTASPRFGTIGVVGHMASGVDSAGTAISGLEKFDTNAQSGTVYIFNSLIDAIDTIGTIPIASTWTSGTFVGDGTDTSPYDTEFNLIRALELIYLASPSARCKVAILTASGTLASTAQSTAGVTTALAALKKEEDISFLVGAGMDFNTIFLAAAIDHASDGKERMYIGGTSLNTIMESGTLTPDVTVYSSLREANGRGINYLINVSGTFSTDISTERSEAREIGGNFLSAYLAGILSTQSESSSLLKSAIGYNVQRYNEKDFKWDKSSLEDLYSGSFVFAQLKSGVWKYGSSRTYATAGSIYQRVTTRRIVDRVESEKRAIGDVYVGENNTITMRNTMRSSIDGRMLILSQLGLIGSDYSNNVYINETDIANGIVRVTSVYSPITEIEYVVQHSQININS
jgi:hypothetical protein